MTSQITNKCTTVTDDYGFPEEYIPPNCPVCGGFIKWIDEGEDLVPVCNKCGAELILLPFTEDGEVIEGMNKICPLSGRKK